MSLLEHVENGIEHFLADVRAKAAEEQATIDADAEKAKAFLAGPLGQAITAAVHIPDETLIAIIGDLEAGLAKIAGGPGTPEAAEEQATPADTGRPSGTPVVGGSAL